MHDLRDGASATHIVMGVATLVALVWGRKLIQDWIGAQEKTAASNYAVAASNHALAESNLRLAAVLEATRGPAQHSTPEPPQSKPRKKVT